LLSWVSEIFEYIKKVTMKRDDLINR
jgi:hypothetical protein